MNPEIAISVSHVSKTFKIPHEKISSLRGAVTGAFKKGGFEEFKALDDVSFEVKKGEFFARLDSRKRPLVDPLRLNETTFRRIEASARQGIIGRNGSGKSTLLKILAGIYIERNLVKKALKSLKKQVLMVLFQILTGISEYANIETAKIPAPIFG
jgi:ABC-2 type transport system ATP-binding protein